MSNGGQNSFIHGVSMRNNERLWFENCRKIWEVRRIQKSYGRFLVWFRLVQDLFSFEFIPD